MTTKKIMLSILVLSSLTANGSEIISIKLSDGEIMKGKLEVPGGQNVIKEIVIYVHGTGPATYLNHRKINGKELNYFDLFSGELNKRGIAFFSYNQRGTDTSSRFPFYDSVNIHKYSRYRPSTAVDDIELAIKYLKKDKRFTSAKVVLLGWSEGTILASMVAANHHVTIDALLLAGYVNDNMMDIIKWQLSGESSMKNIGIYFDKDESNSISREEFLSNEKMPTAYRTQVFKNEKFETLDANKDSVISGADFKIFSAPQLKALLHAFETEDNDWIWKNYFRITSAWFKEHCKVEANKTRLLRVTIPIYIFQGLNDANTPVEGVFDLEERFRMTNKTNLKTYIFKNHDHNLNYSDWPVKGKISDGLTQIFKTAESFTVL